MDVREKLVEIEQAAEWFEKMAKNTPMPMTRKMFEFAGEVLREKANSVTVPEWISVKDRLPEKDGQYLIFTTQYFTPDHIDENDHRDGIEISGYCKGYGFLSTNGIYAKYWCRLPQPPKGE